MTKRDYSQINTGRVYDTIAEATAEPETRKARKEYDAQEIQEFQENMKTSGRKGVKMARINMAFTPDVYEYIQVMSRVTGTTMTEFLNTAMRQHIRDHRELYDKAIEFRNSLNSL